MLIRYPTSDKQLRVALGRFYVKDGVDQNDMTFQSPSSRASGGRRSLSIQPTPRDLEGAAALLGRQARGPERVRGAAAARERLFSFSR
ncbi:hypothetical protein EVAR_67238_1 [Eumeta japonica]|uniref:Uncharacterized protein n=1 Tax=Eumeta variegata TaxID=151549 RepID=A0A4C1YUD7_EUMVA|nr:hypothetical protein EVAR_67238_1 [Eumeta japonica]